VTNEKKTPAQRLAQQVVADTEGILASLDKLASVPGPSGKLILTFTVEGDVAGLSSPGPLLEGEPDPGPQDPIQALKDLAKECEHLARPVDGATSIRWRIVRVLEEGAVDG